MGRLVVTLAAVALAALLGAIRVDEPLEEHGLAFSFTGERLLPLPSGGSPPPPITLAGAGLLPLAFVFLWLNILKDSERVRRWRAYAPLVAAVAALPFAGYLALYFQKTTPVGVDPPIAAGLLVAALSLGSAASTGLGALASRWGVGNGFLLVSVGASLLLAWDPMVLLGGGLLAPLLAVLVDRRRRVELPELRAPLALSVIPGGLAGLALGPRVGTIPVAVLGPFFPALQSPWIGAVLALAATAFFTYFGASLSTSSFFVARHAVGEAGARPLSDAIERRLHGTATTPNAVVVTVLTGVALLLVPSGFDLAAALWIAAALATLGLDARDEARAPADLVELGEAPRLLEADRMRDVLAAAGIPSHVRCAHGWQVLGGLWPFVPLPLLVTRADAERARAVLERDAPFLIGSPALAVRAWALNLPVLPEAPPP